jgi:hypothetical protein
MALFTKGKGPRQQAWEIERVGSLVRARERQGAMEMLPGFLTCESEPAAQSRVETMVADWLAKGYSAADAEAKTLAACPGAMATRPASPDWPLRADYQVYNEANGMMVTSLAMAGKRLDEGSKKWLKAVNDGKMIPLALYQDDSFNIRVVGGQDLDPQETEEWVARLEWPLEVPDGKLAITGGAILVNEEYEAGGCEESVASLQIPKGRYRATLYTHLPGVNGQAALDHLAGGYGKARPAGAWWRASRSGQTMPAWLRQRCVAYPDTDPGHESEWEGVESLSQDQTPDVIDFLLHLQRDDDFRPERKFVEQDGWFPLHEGARQPEICPRGLEGRQVRKPTRGPAGKWVYVVELGQAVERFSPTDLEGGELALQPAQLAQLYRLARFCHTLSVPQFRAEGACNEATVPEGEGYVLVTRPERTDLLFSNDHKPHDHEAALRELASWFSGWPAGTRWELSCAQSDPRGREGEQPLGLHRYVGKVHDSGWVLCQTYPPAARSEVEAALALAREVSLGEAFTLRDEAEADPVRSFARGNHGPWLEDDNKPVVKGGKFSLHPPDAGLLGVYGSAAFAVRHRGTWPVLDFSEG